MALMALGPVSGARRRSCCSGLGGRALVAPSELPGVPATLRSHASRDSTSSFEIGCMGLAQAEPVAVEPVTPAGDHGRVTESCAAIQGCARQCKNLSLRRCSGSHLTRPSAVCKPCTKGRFCGGDCGPSAERGRTAKGTWRRRGSARRVRHAVRRGHLLAGREWSFTITQGEDPAESVRSGGTTTSTA